MTNPLLPDERKTNPWTEEQIAEMLRMVKDGEAASAIAFRIGKSRCAVLGKLSRLEHAGQKIERRGAMLKQGAAPAKGIVARHAPSLPTVEAAQRSPVAVSGMPLAKRGRPAYSKVFGPVVSRPLREPLPFVDGSRIGLMQLTSSTCKWPIGDPQDKDFCFCGHEPRFNSPYCEFHARAAYQPMQDRRHRVFG